MPSVSTTSCKTQNNIAISLKNHVPEEPSLWTSKRIISISAWINLDLCPQAVSILKQNTQSFKRHNNHVSLYLTKSRKGMHLFTCMFIFRVLGNSDLHCQTSHSTVAILMIVVFFKMEL